MDSVKGNPEPNSSEEEADFESADEGEDTGIEKAATSADMTSEHSTSKISVGTEVKGGARGDVQAEMDVQQSLATEGVASSVDSLVTVKNEETSPNTDITAVTMFPVDFAGNPQDHGEADNSSETPDGGKDAMGGNDETAGSSSVELGSDIKGESGSEKLEETDENINGTDGKSSDGVTEEPGKGQGESTTSASSDGKEQTTTQGGWGWGSWLSQATASITSVIETVESSLGVPDPNEMAKKVKEEEEQVQKEDSAKEGTSEDTAQGTEGAGTFLSFGMSALTNVVQNRGMDLVTGGLDALEFIGKRTMDVLSEGDVGLREKRVQLLSKGPTLSQVLREGKEASEAKASHSTGQEGRQAPAVDVFTKFEEHQGMAHLEALEILSHECEAKVESQMIDLADEDLNMLKPVLRAVEQVFHIEEDDEDDYSSHSEGDFEMKVVENLSGLNLNVRPDKLISTHKLGKEWLDACVEEQDAKPGHRTGQEIYETAVGTMGELMARTVEIFHKFAELIVFQSGFQASALVHAQCLRKLTETVSRESSTLATHFAGCLNTAVDDAEDPDVISPLITNIYLDSSTGTSYLHNSFKLLCPILQLSSLNEKKMEKY